jgi:hypothetical protein
MEKIEIAQTTRKSLTYAEAQMYCFVYEENNIRGWRLPTEDEYVNHNEIWGWVQDDERQDEYGTLRVTPVRDL